jgi:hypothetical protein
MALLATQQIQITGPAITLTAAAGGGDTVSPSDRTFLWVKNASGSPITVTVVVPGVYFGQNLPDSGVSVPATTGERMIGPLDQRLADPTTQVVGITYSGVTSLTVAAVRI